MIVLILIAILSGSGYVFMQQKQFGADPKGKRLERIEKSPNYKNGSFQNLSNTPVMAEGVSFFTVMKAYLKKIPGKEPSDPLPSVRTNLKTFQAEVPTIIWFGHSSYLIYINGKKILVDPVFSGNAAPVSFFAKNYKGSNIYSADDFPDLDAILITHDHYDHLDYKSIIALKNKTKHFYTSLGVGAHLNKWGVDDSAITEFDWWETIAIDSSMKLTATPARHFSGRKFTRGKTLWASYILTTDSYNIFLGGDSGYDTHFKTIGEKYGPFDIALLECGQYNTFWRYIHMQPEETAKAAEDLQAKVLMPVHWSKFTLALHTWKEPITRLLNSKEALNQTITTPKIGEPVMLGKQLPQSTWWESLK